MAAVTIWYFGWANKTFKGPVRTIDSDDGGGAAGFGCAGGCLTR